MDWDHLWGQDKLSLFKTRKKIDSVICKGCLVDSVCYRACNYFMAKELKNRKTATQEKRQYIKEFLNGSYSYEKING